MDALKFKVMSDCYGKLGLYKKVEKADPTAMEGWLFICGQEDFQAVIAAIPVHVEE